ncbi:hypothetical protein HanRHA438_Chr15g0702751 [Helianthus annuus]|nr:hypothetical protein HanRHA438_Chr15g0702751 [Helianthus annuus]
MYTTFSVVRRKCIFFCHLRKSCPSNFSSLSNLLVISFIDPLAIFTENNLIFVGEFSDYWMIREAWSHSQIKLFRWFTRIIQSDTTLIFEKLNQGMFVRNGMNQKKIDQEKFSTNLGLGMINCH